jgi:hypothetical protein
VRHGEVLSSAPQNTRSRGVQSACDAVASITDHFNPPLTKEFGGRTFFADQKASEAAAAPEQKESTGLYL